MALQFSLLLDEGRGPGPSFSDRGRAHDHVGAAPQRARHAWWSIVRHPVWAGLTINLAVWAAILLIVLVVWCQRRIRWSWGMVGDAVAIETTRHPEPLSSALRRLAGHNDGVVPVRQTWGAADPWWALTVRANIEIATMVVNDRARTRSSTEQVSDAALLLRARIVEQVCLRHEAATVASWQEAESIFARLARGVGRRCRRARSTAPSTASRSRPTARSGPSRRPTDRGRRRSVTRRRGSGCGRRDPSDPDAAALAAYDEAVASGLRPF